MSNVRFTTWYADRTRGQALLILAITSAALAWLLSAALLKRNDAHAPAQGGNDLRLYRSIVERVHAGENYYDAAGTELRARGYPTGSVFNWRAPVYAWVLGKLPAPVWGQVLLALLAIVTLLMAVGVLQREAGTWPAAAGVLLLLGPFVWCIDGDAFFAQELWAGVLITFSVCAYGYGRWPMGLGAGLCALFFRELTLPYCLIAAGLAWRQGRRREVLAWVAGFALYAIFLAFHAREVLARVTPADRVPGSWLQFGGAPFLLATCRMNVFLFALPAWVSALYLPLSLLGLLAWRGPVGTRLALTAGTYVAAFSIVGQPFNNYWGLLYTPLLSFGIVRAPVALIDLCKAIVRPMSAWKSTPAQPGSAQSCTIIVGS
ncbi:MAG TPA: hypothetical protein VK395_36705 [Gemmataceae bacterium]|nr:hypothetical protein [Gemmataceae bacterium]